MLSRASLGHMHKRLSHGPAEVREESYYGLGTRTTCESTINPKSKKGTTLNFNWPYMVRRVRQTNLLFHRCNSIEVQRPIAPMVHYNIPKFTNERERRRVGICLRT